MYIARVTRLRTGAGAERELDSADLAARHLVMLMVADGWSASPDETARSLAEGDQISHKGFAYSVHAA